MCFLRSLRPNDTQPTSSKLSIGTDTWDQECDMFMSDEKENKPNEGQNQEGTTRVARALDFEANKAAGRAAFFTTQPSVRAQGPFIKLAYQQGISHKYSIYTTRSNIKPGARRS